MSEPSPQPPEAPTSGRPPRGPWITETEVWKACEKLAAQRIPLTTPRVREAIGNRGSNNTVLRYIDSWKAAHREQPEEVVVTPPSPAPDQLREPMQLVWDRARLEVREEVAAEREALAIKARELDERHEKDQKEIEAVRLLNDQLKSIVDALGKRLDASEKSLSHHTAVMAERLKVFTEAHIQVSTTVTDALALNAKAQASGLTTLAYGIGDLASKAAEEARRSQDSRDEATAGLTSMVAALGELKTAADSVVSGFDATLSQMREADLADRRARDLALTQTLSGMAKPLADNVSALGARLASIDTYVKDAATARSQLESRVQGLEQTQVRALSDQSAWTKKLEAIANLVLEIRDVVTKPTSASPPGE